MFGLFKKSISAEEWGHGLWIFVCDAAEKFCRDYQPKLEIAGYLQNPNDVGTFRDEVIFLHMWVVTHIYGDEFRSVLDSLHRYANMFSGALLVSRYNEYENAFAKEGELRKKGISNPVLGKEALKHFICSDSNLGFTLVMNIELDIHCIIIAANKCKSELRIR